MNLKPRVGAFFALILCSGLIVFEWLLRTRVGMVHPLVLITMGAGLTLSFTGLVAPAITEPTAEGKLSPLAHKIGLVGFAIGGAIYFYLR